MLTLQTIQYSITARLYYITSYNNGTRMYRVLALHPPGLSFSRCAYASLRIFAVRLLEELTRELFGCNAAATLWVAAIKD